MAIVRAPWIDAVLDGRPPAPTVLVVGGFITSPPIYRPFVRALRRRGLADVVVAGAWTPDWILAARLGLGRVAARAGRALIAASERSAARSGGAPVLVIGHSAGGMIARLLTSPVPFAGRPLNGAARMGAIVTLGTPHVVVGPDERRARVGRAGAEAAAFANREIPGPAFAPRVGYLALASRSAVGRRDGTAGERSRWELYRTLLPDPPEPVIEGDGVVPLACALLPDAPSIVFDDVAHGQWPGRPWYGSETILDRWWPSALETWQGALLARATA